MSESVLSKGDETRQRMQDALPGTRAELAAAAGITYNAAKYHVKKMLAFHEAIEIGERLDPKVGRNVTVYGVPGTARLQPRKLEVNSPWKTIWVGGPPYGEIS